MFVNSYIIDANDVAVWITDDNNQYHAYFMKDFMLLDKWREQQINKIIE